MKLSDRIDEIRVALELFPKCLRCGGDLSAYRLTEISLAPDRVNRFVHLTCPSHADDRL